MSKRKISAFFSVRKRLPIKLFGANVSETIRIPANPLIVFGLMIFEKLLSRNDGTQKSDEGKEE